jgi:CarboxypepD_reg-like domain
MRIIFSFWFSLVALVGFAQRQISGVVQNAETKEPIAGALLYINNTSQQVVSNAEGKFTFNNVAKFSGEIIANSLGFNFAKASFDAEATTVNLLLKPVAKLLDDVTIRTPEKDGYQKWGGLFTDLFIGKNEEKGTSCKILNTKVLKFFYDKKSGILNVSATEPLQIENKYLGFMLTYTLEEFEFNIATNIVFYSGYPSFAELGGKTRKMKAWLQNRDQAFANSVLHFMRSLYRNELTQQGFALQIATKVVNKEKLAAKQWLKKNLILNKENVIDFNANDSMGYFSKKVNEPDSLFALSNKISSDSVAFAIDSTTAGLFFEKYLAINFTPGIAASGKQTGNVQTSFVKLLRSDALEVYANGSFYNTNNFFMASGFWAATEKIYRLLPYDYLYKTTNSLIYLE